MHIRTRRAFPKLEDLRLWTSAPQIRHLDSSDFPKLHSVLLGGLQSNRILKDLVRVIGHQLTTLKGEVLIIMKVVLFSHVSSML